MKAKPKKRIELHASIGCYDCGLRDYGPRVHELNRKAGMHHAETGHYVYLVRHDRIEWGPHS